jgi:hypothetical protein
MVAAVIGLLGVLAGAVLAGVVSFRVERRKQVLAAFRAGRLIAAELSTNRRLLQNAPKQKQWWTAELSNSAWTGHRSELATDVGEELLEKVTLAYGLIDTLTHMREAAQAPGAEVSGRSSSADDAVPTERQLTVIKRGADQLEETRTNLDDWLHEIEREQQLQQRWRRRMLRVASGVLAAAVAALLILLVFYAQVPRVELTTSSVATVLQEKLGDRTAVECDTSGDDWTCTVYQLAQSRDSCPATRATSASQSVSMLAAAEPAGQPTDCAIPVTSRTRFSVAEENDNLVAVPDQPMDPASKEAMALIMAMEELEPLKDPPRQTWWERFWGKRG